MEYHSPLLRLPIMTLVLMLDLYALLYLPNLPLPNPMPTQGPIEWIFTVTTSVIITDIVASHSPVPARGNLHRMSVVNI